jgi:peptide/nickel transport system ATP-binding protein
LFRNPRHPYTQALLASVLTPEPGLGLPEDKLGAAPPDPFAVGPGCPFAPRCRLAADTCRTETPLQKAGVGGYAVCHFA